jgi:hypothetical protein
MVREAVSRPLAPIFFTPQKTPSAIRRLPRAFGLGCDRLRDSFTEIAATPEATRWTDLYLGNQIAARIAPPRTRLDVASYLFAVAAKKCRRSKKTTEALQSVKQHRETETPGQDFHRIHGPEPHCSGLYPSVRVFRNAMMSASSCSVMAGGSPGWRLKGGSLTSTLARYCNGISLYFCGLPSTSSG